MSERSVKDSDVSYNNNTDNTLDNTVVDLQTNLNLPKYWK